MNFVSEASGLSVAMNENGEKRTIRAGLASMADEPRSQQASAAVQLRLKMLAEGFSTAGATYREAMEAVSKVFSEFASAMRNSAAELRAEQEKVFTELAAELRHATEADELAQYGFSPAMNDLEAWEELARIVGKEPSQMTMDEIYLWAIAWAKRELWRQKLSRGELPIQSGDASPKRPQTTPPEDIGIRPDENDSRFAWCMGKRIYLGKDSQIGRLFWLLASPIGRAHSLPKVQRAIDGFETARDLDLDGDGFKQASQRLRKAISKLRQALRAAKVDAHLLIIRGGDSANPEYTMVQRFIK